VEEVEVLALLPCSEMNLPHLEEVQMVEVEEDEDPCPCSNSKNMGPYWLSMSELAHPLILASKDGISTCGDLGDGGEQGG
jgi:hypothetical protein